MTKIIGCWIQGIILLDFITDECFKHEWLWRYNSQRKRHFFPDKISVNASPVTGSTTDHYKEKRGILLT